jgi:uncharacterized Zn finger protein
MSPEEEIIRAGEAKQILDSRMFQEACKRVADSLAAQRRQVPIRDTDMHTRLIITEQLWGNIADWLKETADTGQFAQFTIRQREAQRKGLFSVFSRG